MLHHISTPQTEEDSICDGAMSFEQEPEPEEFILARKHDQANYAQRKQAITRLAHMLGRLPTASGVILYEGFWMWLFFNHTIPFPEHNTIGFIIYLMLVNLLGIPILNAWLLLWKWVWKYPVNGIIRLKRESTGVDDEETFKFEP